MKMKDRCLLNEKHNLRVNEDIHKYRENDHEFLKNEHIIGI